MYVYFKESVVMPFRGSTLDLESDEAIARRLRTLRKALGKTQEGMAGVLGSTTRGQVWANYENYESQDWRRISLDMAIILAKKLNISLDWVYLGRVNYLPIDLADKLRDAEAVLGAEERRQASRRV